MISIVSADDSPHHLTQLRQWCVAEWGEFEPFGTACTHDYVPSPLLAVNGPELLGGLVFSSYPAPGGEELGLWINGLIVAPGHRRKGLASQLIRAAEAKVIGADPEELFVYTSIPELYRRLGWQAVDSDGNGTVLSKTTPKR